MYPLSTHFSDLKQEIANSYPDFEKRITIAWGEIIDQLNETTEAIAKEGSEVRRLWPNQILASISLASTFRKSNFPSFRASERRT